MLVNVSRDECRSRVIGGTRSPRKGGPRMNETPTRSTVHTPSRPGGAEEPVGELVQRASQQLTELVRGELRLAQAEMKEKGKRYAKGGGLFGGAGLFGFLMLEALVATAIAALAVPLPVWAAALIVTAVLGVIAGVLALTGKKQVTEAA